jgi:DNA-binding HxlR family transcriptional regulator
VRAREIAEQDCSIARPAALLGDRWTLMVLRQAFAGVRRFDGFQQTLECSRSVLAERLALLVEHGILTRAAYEDGRRTRFEYRLTDKGLDLYPVLMALRTWGDAHMAESGPPLLYRHVGCGGEAVVTHRCARCDQELGARDVEVRPRARTDTAAPA